MQTHPVYKASPENGFIGRLAGCSLLWDEQLAGRSTVVVICVNGQDSSISCCVRAGAFLERVEERLPVGHQPFFSNGMFGLDSTTASSSFVANLGVELND